MANSPLVLHRRDDADTMSRNSSVTPGVVVVEENPFASPASDLAPSFNFAPTPVSDGIAWRRGDLLIVAKDAVLPDRCIKCNGHASRRMARTYYWHSPAVYVTLLAGVLIYVILALVLRKACKLNFALCGACSNKRQQKIWIGVGVLLAGVALFVGGIALADRNDLMLLGLPAGLVTFLIGCLMINDPATVLSAKEIDDRTGRFANAGRAFLDTLPIWPGR